MRTKVLAITAATTRIESTAARAGLLMYPVNVKLCSTIVVLTPMLMHALMLQLCQAHYLYSTSRPCTSFVAIACMSFA